MSSVRHCAFYPTAKGWFLELADEEYGEYEAADTHGPAPTYYEINRYLYNYFSNPGGENVSLQLREVPRHAPNGSKVKPVPKLGPHDRSYPASFIAAESETLDVLLYDTARDIIFSVMDGKLERVHSAIFWGNEVPVTLEDAASSSSQAWSFEAAPQPPLPKALPASPAAWEALSRSIAAHWLSIGRSYHPVILAGLDRQPLPADQVAA